MAGHNIFRRVPISDHKICVIAFIWTEERPARTPALVVSVTLQSESLHLYVWCGVVYVVRCGVVWCDVV